MKRRRFFGALIASLLCVAVLGPGKPPAALEVTNISSTPGQPQPDGKDAAYWVPLDAPTETMPISTAEAHGCGPKLTTWLERYGTSLAPQKILIWNTSGTSQHIRVQTIGRESTSSQPGVVVQCGFPLRQESAATVLPGAVSFDPVTLMIGGPYAGVYTDEARSKEFERTLQPGEQSGISAELIGYTEFTGEIVVRSEIGGVTTTSSIPLRIGSASPESSIHWPGMRGQELVRVAFRDKGKMYCQRADDRTLGSLCDPSLLRSKALAYRDAVAKARSAIERETQSPSRPVPTTNTKTKVIHVDPWSDSLQAPKVTGPPEGFVNGCNQDAYRPDRIDCTASTHCYLNADLQRALCPTMDLTRWQVMRVDGNLETSPGEDRKDLSVPPSPHPISLRLSDGSWCAFGTGAGPNPPPGYDFWAGTCRKPGSDNNMVIWEKASADLSRLGLRYLLPPGDENYLRVAVGPENQPPKIENVTEIYY